MFFSFLFFFSLKWIITEEKKKSAHMTHTHTHTHTKKKSTLSTVLPSRKERKKGQKVNNEKDRRRKTKKEQLNSEESFV